MERRYSPDHIAKVFGVTKGTVIGWCADGTMPAVNVARAAAKRARWRMSEEDVETFKARRANRPEKAPEAKASRRTIARPTKDYFANVSGGEPATEIKTKSASRRTIAKPTKDYFAPTGGAK